MNAGTLPIGLLFIALGLGLSFASLRTSILSAVGAAITAVLISSLTIGPIAPEWVFVGLWCSVIGTVGLMHLWTRIPLAFAAVAGINAGAWAGTLAATSSLRSQMILALPILLIFFLGNWLVEQGYGIALKVVGSWVVAIAILAICVSLTPTPGYKPDHMQ